MPRTRVSRRCIAAVAVSLAGVARAEPGKAPALFWSAPPECPQAEIFAQEVENLLGQLLASHRQQNIVVGGAVERDEVHGFSVSLHIATDRGVQVRVLSHTVCAELTEAAALVAALAIDPTLEGGPEVTPAPDEPVAPPTAAYVPERSEPNAPALPPPPPPRELPAHPAVLPPPRASAYSLSGAFLGFVGVGALPEAGIGVGAEVAFELDWFRLLGRGSYWLPRFAALSGAGGPGVELELFSFGLRGCTVPFLRGRLGVAACLGPELGDLQGHGVEVDNSRTRHARLSALMGEVSTIYRPRPGSMAFLSIEAGKTLEAPPFGIVQNGERVEIFQPASWIARASLGLGVL